MPFTLPPLPYAYNALEPYIDAQTMQLHHDRHMQTYVNNLNAALEACPQLQNCSLKQLLLRSRNTAVLRNAGGVYNHEFFFLGMTPGGSAPSGRLAAQIQRQYGSAAAFQAQFKARALEVFGSGYTWLCCNRRGQLCIVTTCGQDTPLAQGLCPLACIDVWEHAYYLKHFNVRADYIDAWFKVANFGRASELYCP
ncbi:MAG: superoxide dismutase [Oscillospiraceae bacterium]|nr:superoxide dismutase [Oscillospiraceae bacterium]